MSALSLFDALFIIGLYWHSRHYRLMLPSLISSFLLLRCLGVVSTLAGRGGKNGYKDGTGTEAQFFQPYGVAVDSGGNIYVADMNNNRIRKITAGGEVSTLAGSGEEGFADGTGAAYYKDGPGTEARFQLPTSVAVDSEGNVYVADYSNHRIRKITAGGVVTTLAGTTMGYKNGTGAEAQFYNPRGVAVDSAGNIYVADTNNQRIRKIEYKVP